MTRPVSATFVVRLFGLVAAESRAKGAAAEVRPERRLADEGRATAAE